MCTHIYTSHRHYYFSLFPTHLRFFLAGWLTPTHCVGYGTILSNATQTFQSMINCTVDS